MITKRGFLRGASAAAVAAAAPGGSWAAPATGASGDEVGLRQAPTRPLFDVVVFNDRYADARAFAQALGERGAPTIAMSGDAGTLWHRTLARNLMGERRRLAGIGTSMDLLILESLGREVGLRMSCVVQHDSRGSRSVTHVIPAKYTYADPATLTHELGSPDWPVRVASLLADVALRGPVPGCVGNAADLRIVTTAERSEDHPGVLFSWIQEHS